MVATWTSRAVADQRPFTGLPSLPAETLTLFVFNVHGATGLFPGDIGQRLTQQHACILGNQSKAIPEGHPMAFSVPPLPSLGVPPSQAASSSRTPRCCSWTSPPPVRAGSQSGDVRFGDAGVKPDFATRGHGCTLRWRPCALPAPTGATPQHSGCAPAVRGAHGLGTAAPGSPTHFPLHHARCKVSNRPTCTRRSGCRLRVPRDGQHPHAGAARPHRAHRHPPAQLRGVRAVRQAVPAQRWVAHARREACVPTCIRTVLHAAPERRLPTWRRSPRCRTLCAFCLRVLPLPGRPPDRAPAPACPLSSAPRRPGGVLRHRQGRPDHVRGGGAALPAAEEPHGPLPARHQQGLPGGGRGRWGTGSGCAEWHRVAAARWPHHCSSMAVRFIPAHVARAPSPSCSTYILLSLQPSPSCGR